MKCLNCDKPITYDDRGVLMEVIGFAKRRRAGGQNHVIARRETGRLLCGSCATDLTGKHPGQGTFV